MMGKITEFAQVKFLIYFINIVRPEDAVPQKAADPNLRCSEIVGVWLQN